MYYVAAQYRPSCHILHRLMKAQGQTINIAPIAQAHNIAHIIRGICISSAKSISAALDAALIKACIRQYGHVVLVAEGKTNRHGLRPKLLINFVST